MFSNFEEEYLYIRMGVFAERKQFFLHHELSANNEGKKHHDEKDRIWIIFTE
jgi:hypothetical protein